MNGTVKAGSIMINRDTLLLLHVNRPIRVSLLIYQADDVWECYYDGSYWLVESMFVTVD